MFCQLDVSCTETGVMMPPTPVVILLHLLIVVAYIKNKKKIRAMDGDLVYGTFWSMEDDYTVEPYIRVAAGDYLDLCDRWGKDSALTAILLTIGHELTHYFQWINALELTPIGMERQATKYARYVLDDYAETREHP